jgi:hypothetical protein
LGTALVTSPVIVVGMPRSGSSTLFTALSAHPDLWSLYRETTPILEGPLHPARRGWESSAAGATDLEEGERRSLVAAIYEAVANVERVPGARRLPLRGRGRRSVTPIVAAISKPWKRPPIRIAEKSVPNILRIPFLGSLFPDARFVFLTRDPGSNIMSMYRGWLDPTRHNDYPLPPGFEIAGYSGGSWSFLFPPGWKELSGRNLPEVCAFQWWACNGKALDDLDQLEPGRVFRVTLEDFVRRPRDLLRDMAEWADLDPRPFDRFSRRLPRINVTRRAWRDQTASDPEWRAALDSVSAVAARLGY